MTDNFSEEWSKINFKKPVYSYLEETAKNHPNAPAFAFTGKKSTWSDLYQDAKKIAKALQDAGMKKGDRIGLFLPNCALFISAYYGILMAGGIVVNYNPLYASRDLEHQIKDSGTKIMITLRLTDLLDRVEPLLNKTPLESIFCMEFAALLPFPKSLLFKFIYKEKISKISFDERIQNLTDLMANNGKINQPVIDTENDVALLQYTGGTTGTPKGAMLTHANLVANVEQSYLWFNKPEPTKEVMVGVLPFFHVFAMTAIMNLGVKAAMEIVAIPRFDLKETLKLISKHKPTYFPAVPAIYTAINNHKELDRYDLTSIKYCISGGAPLPVEVKRQFEELTHCTLVEGYGLTEASPVVCINPIDEQNKAGSIGFAVPGCTIRITSLEDGVSEMPVGEKGELCVKGPQVMKGYWGKQDETDKCLKDGFLHTGDVAIIDEDGFVSIVDRIKDLILTNGYNVYPRQVEEAIYLHEDIEECIVGGLPDSQRGEKVKAWVKLKEGSSLTESELSAFLKDKLSPIQMPRAIEIRDEPLPKTMIGKLSRKDIIAEELNKS